MNVAVRSLTMSPKCIYLMLMTILAVLYCGEHQASAEEQVKERIENIANKVDAVESELETWPSNKEMNNVLDTIDQSLDRIHEHLGIDFEQTLPGEEQKVQDDEQDDLQGNRNRSLVSILSVERFPEAYANRFKLKYRRYGNSDVTIFVKCASHSKVTHTIGEKFRSVSSVSFACKRTPNEEVFVIFRIPYAKSILSLRKEIKIELDNSELRESSQVLETQMEVDPPDAFEYKPGQNLDVQASVPLTYYGPMPFYTGLDLSTGRVYHPMRMSFRENSAEDDTRKIMTVEAEDIPFSGYITFMAFRNYLERGPLKKIQVIHRVEVYPVQQSSVLPAGFVGFMYDNFSVKSNNGNTLFLCRGYECEANCEVVGYPPPAVKVYRVLPGGTKELVPSMESQKHKAAGDAVKRISWKYQPDGDKVTTYQCVAIDKNGVDKASKIVDAAHWVEAGIDKNRSYIAVTNSSNTNIKNVTFHCAVHGTPLPTVVIFEGASVKEFFYRNVPKCKTIFTGVGRAVHSITLTVDVDTFLEKVTSDTEPKDEVTSDTEPKDEVTSDTEPKDEVTSDTEPKDEVTSDTEPKDEVTSDTEPKDEVTSDTEPKDEVTSDTEPKDEVTSDTEPKDEVKRDAESKDEFKTDAEPRTNLCKFVSRDENDRGEQRPFCRAVWVEPFPNSQTEFRHTYDISREDFQTE